MPIRSRASAEGQALQSGLFPTQKGRFVCGGAGVGVGGEIGAGVEKTLARVFSPFFLFSPSLPAQCPH